MTVKWQLLLGANIEVNLSMHLWDLALHPWDGAQPWLAVNFCTMERLIHTWQAWAQSAVNRFLICYFFYLSVLSTLLFSPLLHYCYCPFLDVSNNPGLWWGEKAKYSGKMLLTAQMSCPFHWGSLCLTELDWQTHERYTCYDCLLYSFSLIIGDKDVCLSAVFDTLFLTDCYSSSNF